MKRNIVPLMTVQFFIFFRLRYDYPCSTRNHYKFKCIITSFRYAVIFYSLTSFLTAPLWGKISDRAGRRPVLLIGILGYSISFS